jgi:hypothetical protein
MKQLCLILLIILNFSLNSKLKNKNKIKSKISKSQKDGPLLWDNLQYDQTLAKLLKDEEHGEVGTVKESNFMQNKMKLISQNQFLSQNQKSKTFKTVGPNDDSTINSLGKKYSKIYKRQNNNSRIHPGYYGKSRLTR